MSQTTKRRYDEVFPVASHIVEKLAPHCERIELAGSLRRGRSMVGDIEIVALPTLIHNLVGDPVGSHLDGFLAGAGVVFSKNGPRYKQFDYGAFTVDLFLPASPAHWGWRFMQSTGSHDFNMWLVGPVKARAGVVFSGGLLYRDGVQLHTPEESDVFDALGLPWIPPAKRDDEKWFAYLEAAHA